jgi:hypothetical protein
MAVSATMFGWIAVVAVLAACVGAVPTLHGRLQERLERRQAAAAGPTPTVYTYQQVRRALLKRPERDRLEIASKIIRSYRRSSDDAAAQTLDHFSPTDTRTFAQRYFMNNTAPPGQHASAVFRTIRYDSISNLSLRSIHGLIRRRRSAHQR